MEFEIAGPDGDHRLSISFTAKEDHIWGFCICNLKSATIENMAVFPQRCGYGKSLLQKVEEEMCKAGYEYVYLLRPVKEALPWWQAQGYQKGWFCGFFKKIKK